ncbi:hypothetical protein FCL54_11045 [Pseudalkalibacillus caeni]|uniref:Uncharacterized protein n=1 Tax=Exobacillus caeni TaxID=2574798 RepID=A0A5R9F3I9_9BACL|nr:hypothetical protein FCL54_11045 [Pseudalkalibacillus caeni]
MIPPTKDKSILPNATTIERPIVYFAPSIIFNKKLFPSRSLPIGNLAEGGKGASATTLWFSS